MLAWGSRRKCFPPYLSFNMRLALNYIARASPSACTEPPVCLPRAPIPVVPRRGSSWAYRCCRRPRVIIFKLRWPRAPLGQCRSSTLVLRRGPIPIYIYTRVHAGPTRFRPGGHATGLGPCLPRFVVARAAAFAAYGPRAILRLDTSIFWAAGPFYRPPRSSFKQCTWSVALPPFALHHATLLFMFIFIRCADACEFTVLAEGVSSARPVYILGYVPFYIQRYALDLRVLIHPCFCFCVCVSLFFFMLIFIYVAPQKPVQLAPFRSRVVWVPCRAVPIRGTARGGVRVSGPTPYTYV